MAKKKPSAIEAFDALSDAEKRRAASEFDREFVADTFRPLTPAQRKLWQKAKRGPGRPRVGGGAKVVSVSIEKELLRRADALAKRRKLTRSELLADALRAALAKAG
jgi:hypothetical protein